jgi:diguanylate cyclase (GGDEF)-like protein/PAS domain S-box-containing protein
VHTHSSFEAKVVAAFMGAVVVVCALWITTWKLSTDSTEALRLVGHTHEVISTLAHIRGDTLQVEVSTQNFRVTGDPAFLIERDAIMATREANLARLQRLTTDNPEQQERWGQLREVMDQRMAISKRVEWLRKTQGQEAANAFVAISPLKETRERSYRLIGNMEEAENQLLQTRSTTQQRTQQLLLVSGVVVSSLLLALLAGSYVLIKRQLRDTEAAHQALVTSEKSLSITLHSIGDAVLATDTEGRITRMNPVAERLTGWTTAEAQGRPIDEVFTVIHELTRETASAPVAKVIATGEVQALANHTALMSRDGKEWPIADSAAPIRDNNGQLVGVVLVFRDETVARLAQHAVREHSALLEQRVQERTLQLRESEDHLRSVINNVPALIAFVDAQQRYVYVNKQYQQRFAPERTDLRGSTVREILGEARYAIAAPIIAKVLLGDPQHYDWQPFPGVWQLISYMPKRDAQNRVAGYYVLGSDITEHKLSEEKIQGLYAELGQRVHELESTSRALRTLSAGNRTMLRATEEQDLLNGMCSAIVEAGGYPMAVVWYLAQETGVPLQAMAQSGHTAGLEGLRLPSHSTVGAELDRGVVATAIRSGQTQADQDPRNETWAVPWQARLHGHAHAVACPLRVGGEVIGALVIYGSEPPPFAQDEITLLTESADDLAFGIANLRAQAEQRSVQAAMQRLTRHDSLTGLPNEIHFTELLVEAIETGTRRRQPFAVLQANIERLSEINDALGFSRGDQMLQEFGARISAAASTSARVARLRGDEFAILLPGCDVGAALAMVRRLEDALARPFAIADIALHVSARIGVSLFPAHGTTPHDLYRHMDIAVHQAKKKGVRHVVYDASLNQNQSHHLNMASELQRAIEAGDLILYVQPKVEISTRRVCGVEGLVRWRHAERGLIPPGEFIGLAEHTGLIKPLTEWVIETGVRLIQDWQRQGRDLPIAINLSARNLRDDSLLDKIRQWQAQWGAAAGLLEMEITESAVMEDAELALRVLHGLRAEGITLYLDDFGTGYSSLSYLQKLPVGYIKVDQSFVGDMSLDNDSAVIVRSTIELAHDLGRKTVAEGVETQAQWDQLAAFGCDMAQGYFIARPMPADDFPAWLANYQAQA